MNEELRKAIKEKAKMLALAIEFRVLPEHLQSYHLEECALECVDHVLSLWQESERWRKVDEELPDVKEKEEYQILVKYHNGEILTFWIQPRLKSVLKEAMAAYNIKEWKIIN